jgi:hypothetical protein
MNLVPSTQGSHAKEQGAGSEMKRYHLLTLSLALMTNLFAWTDSTLATIISNPLNLQQLADKADVVLKAKVVSVQPASEAEAKPLQNEWWKVKHAKLEAISVIKKNLFDSTPTDFVYLSGESQEHTPEFMVNVGPGNFAHFNLEPGSCYILFASKSSGGAYRQISNEYTLRNWDGFIKAADCNSIPFGKSIRDIVWDDLTNLLKRNTPGQSAYARKTLLNLSTAEGTVESGSGDYDRKKVLAMIFSTWNASSAQGGNGEELIALIDSIGAASPFERPDQTIRYAWSKCSSPLGSWAKWEAKSNVLELSAAKFLCSLADDKGLDPKVRGAAVGALGNAQHQPEISALISSRLSTWLASSCPDVQAKAVLLSTDYPRTVTSDKRQALMASSSPSVRANAILASAIMQDSAAIPLFEKALNDKDEHVQADAATALLLLPVDKVKKILIAHTGDPDVGAGFAAKLANADPNSMKAVLFNICAKPRNPYTSTVRGSTFLNNLATDPVSLCQIKLLDSLDSLSGSDLRKAENKKYLQLLEQLEMSTGTGAGFYQLLRTHGMSEEAAAFKKRFLAKNPGYNVSFSNVDTYIKLGVTKMK